MTGEAKARILLVEDDREMADLVRRGLERSGYETVWAPDGAAGLERAVEGSFDLMIADVMMPKMDGLELVAALRERALRLPALMLSAKARVDERVEGLRAGADDYLVKPFDFDELLARIDALLRRSRRESAGTELRVADLRIDLLRGKVFRGEWEIELQPQEYALLVYLVRNKGRVVTRSMVLREVWEYNVDPLTNVVESRVCRLRNKIDRDFEPKLIRTVRGRGYAIDSQE